MCGGGEATIQRVNNVAVAAHGLLYRRQRKRPLPAIWRFFRWDYPRLFRRLWPYVALAFLVFFGAAAATYASVRVRPSRAYAFVPVAMSLPDGDPGLSQRDISERFRSIPRPPMAAGIVTNNISVAFHAFALGITAGVGTCYIILFNAMMLAGFAAHFANHGLAYAFWSFILPHGILEISAVLIAAAAGLRLGISLAIPGSLTRAASLRRGAQEAVKLVLGTVPMFIVAGTIEGFVTPSYAPGGLKILLGVAAAGAAFAYLLWVGRGNEARAPSKPT